MFLLGIAGSFGLCIYSTLISSFLLLQIILQTAMKKKEDTSLKEKVSSIASESNVHGISRIVSDRPKYLRFLWLFAFLGLLSFGVYQVTSIILNFHQYPTKTNFKIGFDPLPFPAITICNMNKIKKSKMNTINSSKLEDILNVSIVHTSHTTVHCY